MTEFGPGTGPYGPAGPSRARRMIIEDEPYEAPRRTASRADLSIPYGRALAWTFVGAVFPGVGLIRAGRKLAGAAIIALIALAGLAVGTIWFVDRQLLLGWAFNPGSLRVLGILLAVVAALWVTIIAATHLALRPERLSGPKRFGGALLVALLSFVVAAPLSVGAVYSYDQASFISTVFTEVASQTRPTFSAGPKSDPWANKERVNILLLGGDSGANRDALLGARTDTIIVASIDTKTGNTVLVSIPRNTARMPFPADSPLHQRFPEGFYDGKDAYNAEYMANAIWDNVPSMVDPNILGPTDNLGADALKLSVGEAVGLKIDYYVFINIDGLKQLIDAIGGVTVNVNTRIPIAGNSEGKAPTGWIEVGPNQHLNGYTAMWYARSRSASSDFARMARQRCVVNAIVKEANPATLVTRYEAIIAAGSAMVSTDIPQDKLSMFVDLSLRVKNATNGIRSVQFTNEVDGFVSANPNFVMMAKRVAQAVTESMTIAPATVAPVGSASPSGSTSPSATPTKKATAKATTSSASVSDECAFHPETERG